MRDFRVKRVQAWMAREDLDAVFVKGPENMRYLTAFPRRSYERLSGVILPRGYPPFLFVPELDLARAQAVVPVERIITCRDGEDPFEGLARGLGMLGVRGKARLGVEVDCLSLMEAQNLESVMPGVRFVDTSVFFSEMRTVKEPEEVSAIERAVQIAQAALDSSLEFLKEHQRTELEVALHAHRVMMEAGAEGAAFDVRVLSGPRTALVYGESSRRVIGEGDIVMMDLGAVYEGYCSDMTRTFVMGMPSHYYLDIYETVLQAEEEALKHIGPGVPCSEVDSVARAVVSARGYSANFIHRTGHGIGLRLHEKPSLAPQESMRLAEGMVLAIEPGVYIPGMGGVRIEDVALVTQDGCRLLSTYQRDPYNWQLGGVLDGKADTLDQSGGDIAVRCPDQGDL
ncbi:MAG: Xaa-Pro peptidase family protein [Bacillota bacterium]